MERVGKGDANGRRLAGTLVNYLGMRRVNTRGLQQANKCMLMAAVAYNLKKLLKWQGKKANTMFNSIEKSLKKTFLLLFHILAIPEGYQLQF